MIVEAKPVFHHGHLVDPDTDIIRAWLPRGGNYSRPFHYCYPNSNKYGWCWVDTNLSHKASFFD